MKLYIDLHKAVTPPNVGTTAKPERQTVASHNSSYGKQPVGVSGGDASPDRPDVGKKWKHSEEDSVDAETEKDHKKENKVAQERNEVPMKKAFSEASELLKSLNAKFLAENNRYKPNDLEKSFLLDVCGYTEEDIQAGRAWISGKTRHTFNRWVNARMSKSLDILRRLP